MATGQVAALRSGPVTLRGRRAKSPSQSDPVSPTVKGMEGWGDDERATLVALLHAPPDGMTWADVTERVADCGSARKVWQDLYPDTLFGSDAPTDALERARADVEAWAAEPFRFLTFLDEDYPARLRDVRQLPPVIFTRGHLLPADHGVSVVGSRKASGTALRFAARVAGLIVERGLTVIAGLASGIDTAAHRAALDHGGRTVAVIGTGIRRQYPAENRQLHDEISERGLLLSQFWPDAPPTRWSFPLRNATMSAYGYATVVVEAGEHSGTRIQAREAVQHGRPVILATSVAQGTSWGRELTSQPGVHVADSPEAVMARLEAILEVDQQVSRLLSGLLATAE